MGWIKRVLGKSEVDLKKHERQLGSSLDLVVDKVKKLKSLEREFRQIWEKNKQFPELISLKDKQKLTHIDSLAIQTFNDLSDCLRKLGLTSEKVMGDMTSFLFLVNAGEKGLFDRALKAEEAKWQAFTRDETDWWEREKREAIREQRERFRKTG
ncbi:hypothetical protein HN587_01255 [Candidatus Woesearchaeota archaeon]|nr:hypothetical protein [Candidatus Woesearchaeota archaeon]